MSIDAGRVRAVRAGTRNPIPDTRNPEPTVGARRLSTLRIRTPEGIEFSLPLAGPTTRFLAWAIDVACIATLTVAMATVVLSVFATIRGDWAAAAWIVAFFCLREGYAMTLEWFWRGQTLGKRLLGLRVLDEQGLRLQFSQVAVRNLLRFIDSAPALYLVGGIACLVSRRAQRIGDLAANTVVVRMPKVADPDLDQMMGGKYNSFRDYPHLEARLRQRVSPEEARIALQALIRRDELDPDARTLLFAEVAAHLKSLVVFPEEATLGLTDEQYVRNAVDVLFRAR